MAGNYLQSLSWRSDPTLLASITLLYTKAKSWESLVSFYSCCAETEVYDYSNYPQAIAANKEALKYAIQCNSPRISELEIVLKCQCKYVESIEESLQELLLDPCLRGVKVEDIYTRLLGIYYSRRDSTKAASLLSTLSHETILSLEQEINDWLGIKETV